MSQYREHERLHDIREQSQTIGEFLDWMLNERGWHVCYYRKGSDFPYPVHGLTIERVLAEYFDIDLDKLEQEKQEMLAAMSKQYAADGSVTQGRKAKKDEP
jgi:hypothetical protein